MPAAIVEAHAQPRYLQGPKGPRSVLLLTEDDSVQYWLHTRSEDLVLPFLVMPSGAEVTVWNAEAIGSVVRLRLAAPYGSISFEVGSKAAAQGMCEGL